MGGAGAAPDGVIAACGRKSERFAPGGSMPPQPRAAAA
jgi:hypothetical protein